MNECKNFIITQIAQIDGYITDWKDLQLEDELPTVDEFMNEIKLNRRKNKANIAIRHINTILEQLMQRKKIYTRRPLHNCILSIQLNDQIRETAIKSPILETHRSNIDTYN